MHPTRPLCAALLCLAASGSAFADARSDLHAAFLKNMVARSYRATMVDLDTGGQVSIVEYQAPDRYRIRVTGRPDGVIAGGNMYVQANGQTMKIPLPGGTLEQYRSDAAWKQMEKDTTFSDAGLGTAGGEPAHKYHWVTTGKRSASGDAWVSVKSGRVVQVETGGTVRVTYTAFDDPSISVAPPK